VSRWISLCLVGCLCALAATPAEAARRRGGRRDTTPPSVEHVPLVKHDGVGPLIVEARIVDSESEVFEPALLVRLAGTETFQRVLMKQKPEAPELWLAEVPTPLLVGDLEYLVEAFDEHGNGPARIGDEAAPLRVERDVPLPPPLIGPTQAEPPPPTGTGPPIEEGPSALVIGAGVAVGAIVLAGAAVGVAFALYALQPPAPEFVNVVVSAPTPVAGAAP
jgi:hypothetical protein